MSIWLPKSVLIQPRTGLGKNDVSSPDLEPSMKVGSKVLEGSVLAKRGAPPPALRRRGKPCADVESSAEAGSIYDPGCWW